jgi:hypothetical protein
MRGTVPGQVVALRVFSLSGDLAPFTLLMLSPSDFRSHGLWISSDSISLALTARGLLPQLMALVAGGGCLITFVAVDAPLHSDWLFRLYDRLLRNISMAGAALHL